MKTKNYAKHYRQEPNGKVFRLHPPSIPHGIYGGGCSFTSGCHWMSFGICDGMLWKTFEFFQHVLGVSQLFHKKNNDYSFCCREGSHMSVCVLLKEGHPSVWAQGCSQTSGEHMSTGTSPYINNSLLISLFLSCFVQKKYFHGIEGT